MSAGRMANARRGRIAPPGEMQASVCALADRCLLSVCAPSRDPASLDAVCFAWRLGGRGARVAH
eukprot:6505274-Prymnesium_polylepis.2